MRDAVAAELALRQPPIKVTNHTLPTEVQKQVDAVLAVRAEKRREAAIAAVTAAERRAWKDLNSAATAAGRRAAVASYTAARTTLMAAKAGDEATLAAAIHGDLAAAVQAAAKWKEAQEARRATMITAPEEEAAPISPSPLPAYRPPWARPRKG